MVVPFRVSLGTNCITMLSVMIRTATRSTSGTLRPSGVASAVRELAARAAIMAVTKPAPPVHKAPNEEGSEMQLQPLKSMIHTLPNMCSPQPRRIMLRSKDASRARIKDLAMILLSNGGTNIQKAGAPSDTILVGTVDGVALLAKTERGRTVNHRAIAGRFIRGVIP